MSVDAAFVAAQFRDMKIPSCTIVATLPAVSVMIADVVLFNVLKLECLGSVSVQGALVVNRLEGLVHTVLNPEKSMIKIIHGMKLNLCGSWGLMSELKP